MADLATGRFITGAGMAAAAARIEGTGWPLAGLLTTMISDPEAMRQGARQWREEPTADGKQAGIAALRTDLDRQFTALESDGHLKGKMLATLKEKHAELNTQLDNFERCRECVSGSLDSGADLYDAASWVSLSLGGSAMAVAVFSQACKGQVLTFAATRPMVARAMVGLGQVAQKVVGTMMKTSWKVAGILTVSGYLYSAASAKFPGMTAIAADVPDLTRAKVAFDPATGGLTEPQPDLGDLGGTKAPSFLPPFSL
ncbi:hypothetical protein [Microbispora siamensis]|uniref:Proteins of 100 residues with WXG n=1 Tax=Microbispora siamensis TaxID=564413 RepID=A0ABQ4GW86_9ACTN|nr:hypothetical protein [Microbispora siamensis]GIH65676.1 hypothetical protein Msi02_64930 [Microbispora siamensis]